MDALKDLIEVFLQRIRSPIIGSIAIAFVLVNWKPVWYLLFAERPARQKILYFEENTDPTSLYLWPIGLGVAYAFGLPWVKYVGAWVAQIPHALLHEIQDGQASARRIKGYERAAIEEKAKANLDATRETALLAAAERRQQASELGEEELSKFVEAQGKSDPVDNDLPQAKDNSPWADIYQVVAQMPSVDQTVLTLLEELKPTGESQYEPSSWLGEDQKKKATIAVSNALGVPVDATRFDIEFKASIERLKVKKLIERDSDNLGRWTVYSYKFTAKGYAVLDKIRQNTSPS